MSVWIPRVVTKPRRANGFGEVMQRRMRCLDRVLNRWMVNNPSMPWPFARMQGKDLLPFAVGHMTYGYKFGSTYQHKECIGFNQNSLCKKLI